MFDKENLYAVIGVVLVLFAVQVGLLVHSCYYKNRLQSMIVHAQLPDEDIEHDVAYDTLAEINDVTQSLLVWLGVLMKNILHGVILVTAVKWAEWVINFIEKAAYSSLRFRFDGDYEKYRTWTLRLCWGASLLMWVITVWSDVSSFLHNAELVNIANRLSNIITEQLNSLPNLIHYPTPSSQSILTSVSNNHITNIQP